MARYRLCSNKCFLIVLILAFFIFIINFLYWLQIPSLTLLYSVASSKKYSIAENYIGKARHWTRTLNGQAAQPNVLILVLTNNELSWGKKSGKSSPRTFQSFLDMIKSTNFPGNNLSLAVFTSSESEYINYIKTLEMNKTNSELFARIRIIYHAAFDSQKSSSTLITDWNGRHDPSLHKPRRRRLARLRNYLMLTSLHSEEHIIWFDADVYIVSANLLQTLIARATNWTAANSLPPGLLTARCRQYGETLPNYDGNAWAGPRKAPNANELADLQKGGIFLPASTKDTKMINTLVKQVSSNDLVRLDSVGGTVLYIKADLVRQGLVFPPYYIIGTTWAMNEGWDGIETEGLCYIAKNLGYGCYALGGDWVVEHSPY